MAMIKKVTVEFPEPMGPRVLHLVGHTDPAEYDGPLLALEEAFQKVFGVDSPGQVRSKTTLRMQLDQLDTDKHYWVVCSDSDVRAMLVNASVIGKQATKVTLLSLDALLEVMKRRGMGSFHRAAIRMHNIHGIFDHELSGDEGGSDAPDSSSADDSGSEEGELPAGFGVLSPRTLRQRMRKAGGPDEETSEDDYVPGSEDMSGTSDGEEAEVADESREDVTDSDVSVSDAEDSEEQEVDYDAYYDTDEEDDAGLLARAFRKEGLAMRRKADMVSIKMSRGGNGRFTQDELKRERIYIKDADMPSDLRRHIKMYLDALRDPGVNLLRAGISDAPLAASTVSRCQKDIRKFFGFLVTVKGWRGSSLSLSTFANAPVFGEYLEYLCARGVKTTEIGVQTLLAVRVNTFLRNLLAKNSSKQGADSVYHKAAIQLQTVGNQLRARMRKETGSVVKEPEDIPLASQAMAFVERVIDTALAAAQEELEQVDFDYLSKPVAHHVRDAAMLGMSVGHVGLTVRISTVRTIKADMFEDTDCTHPDCLVLGCKGNRLVEVAAKYADVDVGGGLDWVGQHQYRLYIPHHKTANRGISMPRITIHSAKLNRLLCIWQLFGRPMVSDRCLSANPAWCDPMTLFIDNYGQPFASLTKWYKAVHEHYKAPYDYISLNKYRRVFVTDRMENPQRRGPSNEGAAVIMGNSVPTWHAAYWVNRRQSQADKAGQAMGDYRQQLLSEAGYGKDGSDGSSDEE